MEAARGEPSPGRPRPPGAAKHPRALYTLFFTEMWERFSYYGMRALLVLFLVDKVRGGFGLSDEVATAIYGIYTASVYLAALPGGWVADRILGAQRSVWYGGILIACGHFTIALDRGETFYLGLMLIVCGTGLLKPNISALVGEIYPEGGARRDAGFTIFYMGINLGAAIGPLICGGLSSLHLDGKSFPWIHFDGAWRYGFGAAGVGMILGLIQFHLTKHRLGESGTKPGKEATLGGTARAAVIIVAILCFIFIGLVYAGAVHVNAPTLARWLSNFISAAAIIYFVIVFFFYKLDSGEKRRVALIGILFLAAALFWMGFEQVGSSFNLFAKRYTDRILFGREIPAEWFQSLGPILIISLSPVMASLWVWLSRRNWNLSIPVKFGLALLLLALGFVAMALAAQIVAGGHSAGPIWLVMTYFLHTVGELCLSPVGLSSVTKLSPHRLVGQMMGVWFLGASLGNLIAGLIAGQFKSDAIEAMPAQFLWIAVAPSIAGILLIILARRIRRSLADI